MSSESPKNRYPLSAPRFWHGMRVRDFWRLLAANHFRISLARWPMALMLMWITVINSILYRIQFVFFEKKIEQLKLEKPPIFIIGHWRSGTTHLHELLTLDQRFTFPNTYDCFVPSHFLLTRRFAPKLFSWLLPSKRPMDNMKAGFDRPQEDEFAFCPLGCPTPYLRMAFPNEPYPYAEMLNLEGADPKDVDCFKRSIEWFVKALTLKDNKQLVLKSPPHTGRLEVLAEVFPGAKFIHITRDPLDLFPSMMRTWRALDEAQGFQLPKYSDEHLEEYIFDAYDRMYGGFKNQRPKIADENFYQIKFEDLASRPVEELEKIYRTLDLGDFSAALPALQTYVEGQKDYKRNKHELNPILKEKIQHRFRWYSETFGYEDADS